MTRLLSDIFDNCSLEELDLLLEDYDEEICDEKSLDRIMSMTLGKTGKRRFMTREQLIENFAESMEKERIALGYSQAQMAQTI